MLLIADQISDALCSSGNESLLSLFDLVSEPIHSYELEQVWFTSINPNQILFYKNLDSRRIELATIQSADKSWMYWW